MTREILLARRLLEAVVDPDAPLAAVEAAGVELAEVSLRLGRPGGRLPVDTFEGLAAEDLSLSAWLLLLEGCAAGEPEMPHAILEALYLGYSDAALRFRLVQGALAHPDTRERYSAALKSQPEPDSIEYLPDSWPRQRLAALANLAKSGEAEEAIGVEQALQELVLYLLQDGSDAARALAAAAVAPDDAWRRPAHAVAARVVRTADPDLSGYGLPFGRARI
ncbi:MAG TPA: hypothetical protein VIU82_01580 [Bosea sp. (in: a-proteobacteria)]